MKKTVNLSLDVEVWQLARAKAPDGNLSALIEDMLRGFIVAKKVSPLEPPLPKQQKLDDGFNEWMRAQEIDFLSDLHRSRRSEGFSLPEFKKHCEKYGFKPRKSFFYEVV